MTETQGNRALVLMELNETPSARELLAEVVATEEMARGQNHPFLARALTNLCVAQWKSRLLDEAAISCGRAYQIKLDALGRTTPDTLAAQANVATLMAERGDLEGSIASFTEAIELTSRALGPEHPNLASMLTSRGEMLYRAGRFDEADQGLERAVTMYDKLLGPQHPALVMSLTWLGRTQYKLGQAKEAERNLNRALQIAEHAGEAQVVEPLLGLSELWARSPRSKELLSRAKKALISRKPIDSQLAAEIDFELASFDAECGPVQQALAAFSKGGRFWQLQKIAAQTWLRSHRCPQ